MKGVILAGGKSKRMGQDKALISVGGESLIFHVYKAFKHQVNEIVISGSQDYNTGLQVISDDPDGPKGPVGALYSIWKYREQTTESGFFTVPVDAPHIPENLCERLYGNKSAIATTPNRTHQAFAWWLYDDLTELFENLNSDNSISLGRISRMCKARHVLWADETLFYNINTPNDLSRYLTDIAPAYRAY